jgi:hypothetical protein
LDGQASSMTAPATMVGAHISSQQPSEITSSINDSDQFDRIIRRVVLTEKKIVAFD